MRKEELDEHMPCPLIITTSVRQHSDSRLIVLIEDSRNDIVALMEEEVSQPNNRSQIIVVGASDTPIISASVDDRVLSLCFVDLK